jgi:cysteine synthase A
VNRINYFKNAIQAIGNTPLVKLNHITEAANVYAKLEFMNPGGSIKDRPALFMIKEAEKKGLLREGGTIIEATAGNTGIGLALVASQKEYKSIFVVPERFSVEKQILMKALGAVIVNTPTNEGMEGAIQKACELAKEIPGSYVPQQFANPANVKAHYCTTGPEIYTDLDGNIDILVAGVGTGGTITGVAKYLKEKDPAIRAIAVEPQGSILGGGKPGTHKTEGIGIDDLDTPKILDRRLIDEVITVQDKNTHEMLHFLARKEGWLVGSSSAAAAYAAKIIAERNKRKGTNIVMIFPDSADRYLSKNLYGEFNEWKR